MVFCWIYGDMEFGTIFGFKDRVFLRYKGQ